MSSGQDVANPVTNGIFPAISSFPGGTVVNNLPANASQGNDYLNISLLFWLNEKVPL